MHNVLRKFSKQIISAIVTLILFTSFAQAAEIIGQWGTGEYYEVHVANDIAYCAASQAGLDILDISDPSNPYLLGNIATQGRAYGVFIVDNLAYVADGREALRIIDISNPATPSLLGSYKTRDEIHRVQVVGNRAYMASNAGGLEIIDVSNPEAPFSLGNFGPRSANQFFVIGTTLYIKNGSTLEILDLQDLSDPRQLGSIDGFTRINSIWVKGGVAYIADGSAGLTLADISNPAAAEIVSSVDTNGNARGVQVIDDRAYVTDDEDGLLIFDVSDPARPRLSGNESTPGSALDLYVTGDIAYVADGYRGLRLIDISKPVMPGTIEVYERSGNAIGLWSDGTIAYMADGEGGLQILDVTDSADPILLGSYYDQEVRCVQAVRRKLNHKAYIGTEDGFRIIDLNDPARPFRIGGCATLRPANAIHVVGDFAYLAVGSRGLEIIDISDPNNPQTVGSYDVPGNIGARNIYVLGSTAFLTCGSYGLYMIDISDPANPVLLGTYESPEQALDVKALGRTAFVTYRDFYDEGSGGLKIINIEDPSHPTLIGEYKIPEDNQTLKVEVVGSRAYLLNQSYDSGSRLEIIDISDLSQPELIQACDLTDPEDLKIVGDLAFIAEGYSGRLSIINLENNPANLYFPHAANSDGWETEIALLNADDLPTQGCLTAYNNQGEVISATKLVTLNPWQRAEFTLSQDFDEAPGISYLTFISGSHNLAGYTKFYHQSAGYRVALPTVTETSADTLFVSHVASDDNWWTGFALVNPTNGALNPILTFSNGTQHRIRIAAGQHKSFSVRDLFAGDAQPELKSAIISDCTGIIGFELFGSIGDGHQLSGISLSNRLATTIYYPHIASDSDWWTGIAAYDPFATNHSFTIRPYTKTGYPLAPKTINLEPGQKKYLNSAKGIGLPEECAWIKLQATSGITGFELFGSQNGDQLGGYTGVGIDSNSGVFAKLDQSGWSGIALVNSSVKTALVTLKARNDSGGLVASRSLYLDSNAKIMGSPETLFSDDDITGASYISYQSGQKLVGFQLNGDGMFLDALPALNP